MRTSPGIVISVAALFVALGGTGVAAVRVHALHGHLGPTATLVKSVPARPASAVDTAPTDVFAPLLNATPDQLWHAIDRTSLKGHSRREFESWVARYRVSLGK